MMNIIHNKNESALVISLEGRLDTVTAPEFESFLEEYFSKSQSRVSFLSMARLYCVIPK